MSAAVAPLLAELRAAVAALTTACERGASDDAAREFGAAQRSLDALRPLLGLPPSPQAVTFAAPSSVVRGPACPRCGEPLKPTASAGFGTRVSSLCGVCGHVLDPA